MKKIFLTLLIVSISILSFGQATQYLLNRPTQNTQFGIYSPIGQIIYLADSNAFYRLTTASIPTSTFATIAHTPITSGSIATSGWSLTGNSGTSPTTNFIGTTDNVPVSIKVNNTEYARFEQDSANVFFKASDVSNKGYDVFAVGIDAAKFNTGNFIIAMGGSSSRGNSGSIVNAIGPAAARDNSGSYVNAIGFNSAQNNTGNYVSAIGLNSSFGNSGNCVNSFGSRATSGNSGSNIIAIGDSSAYNNNLNNIIKIGEGDSTTAFLYGFNRHAIGGQRYRFNGNIHISGTLTLKDKTAGTSDSVLVRENNTVKYKVIAGSTQRTIMYLPLDTTDLLAKTVTEDPTTTSHCIGYTETGFTVDTIFIVMTRTGASVPDIYATVKYGSDISVTGTEMMAASEFTSYSTITRVYSFSSSVIPAHSMIWVKFPTITTIPREFSIRISGH